MTRAQAYGSAGKQGIIVYPTEAVWQKVAGGASFTIPKSRVGVSPSSGQLADIPVVGAQIVAAWSNDTGVNEMQGFLTREVRPGDTVAVVISGNVMTITINGVAMPPFVGTSLTVGGIVLFYI